MTSPRLVALLNFGTFDVHFDSFCCSFTTHFNDCPNFCYVLQIFIVKNVFISHFVSYCHKMCAYRMAL